MTQSLEESIYPPARMGPEGIWIFSRAEFAETRFDYKPGEHCVFAGPTQRGKTTLAFVLLEQVATEELPAYVAVSKPRDPVSEKYGRKLNFRRVSDWPVPRKIGHWNPRGYLVWPKFGDIDTDPVRAARITKHLIDDRYTQGVNNKHGILVMDDTMVKSKLLGLDKEMTTILAMSGAMGIGQWTFVQKPTSSGQTAIWSYGASEHVFVTKDPDRMNQKRYDEIGGVDPQLVARVLRKLDPYQFLYIKRTGSHMCIVDKE